MAYVCISVYGTNQRDHLQHQADAVFKEDWIVHKTLPLDLPLQQLIVSDESGEIEYSVPSRFSGSIFDYSETPGGDSSDPQARLSAALGQLLDPLVDRYGYIGRSPTFLIRSYPQQGGSIVGAALWLPLGTRLIWTSYAIMIYLYLAHWLLSALWVYLDTRARQIYPWKWTMFTVFANIVGLICYNPGKTPKARHLKERHLKERDR